MESTLPNRTIALASPEASRPLGVRFAWPLLWKETLQILPLVATVAAMGVLFHIILRICLASESTETVRESMKWISMMLPNFLALGAPALLISSERESGSLAWLRSLPVSWKTLVIAKFGVGLIALLAMHLIAAGMQWLLIPQNFAAEPLWVVNERLLFASLSFHLLAAGWITALLFQSTLNSLLAVVPLCLMTSFAISFLAQSSYFLTGRLPSHDSTQAAFNMAAAAVLSAIGVTLARQKWARAQGAWFPRRRPLADAAVGQSLSASDASAANSKTDAAEAAFQTSFAIDLLAPSRGYALMWQALRQTWVVTLVCVLLSAISVGILVTNLASPDAAVVPFAMLFLSATLGASCFGLDSVSQRKLFLADHGVPLNPLWFSRLAFPTAGLLVSCLFLLFGLLSLELFDSSRDPIAWEVLGVCSSIAIGTFVCGVICGMWARHFAIAIISSILLFLGCVIVLSYWLPQGGWELLAALFAGSLTAVGLSRLLTRCWVEHQTGWKTHLKFSGLLFCSLAMASAAMGVCKFVKYVIATS